MGRVWSGAESRALTWEELLQRADAAPYVLLGEVHDNPDHHRLQARVLERLAAREPGPAVVFEMLDGAQQARVDAFRAEGGRDPDALARRVGWAGSGWPAFDLYRPVFAAALAADLPILAAGLPRGARPVEPAADPRFGLDRPLPPAERARRLDELFEAHCQLIPRERLAPMLAMQRARDARLAGALLRGAERRGRAALIAGAGHVRDSGVPSLLARAGTARETILAVGFAEVDPEQSHDEAVGRGGFDLLVFTPAAARPDPCESLRRPARRDPRQRPAPAGSGLAPGRTPGEAEPREEPEW